MLWENSKTAVTSWIDGVDLSTLGLSLVAVLTATLVLLVVLRILKVVFRRFRFGIDRWKDTRLGPLRFQQFEAGLPGVAPNTLSARLKQLESQGVIATRLYENHPPRYEYFLTEKGKELGPVLKALYSWGERY